MEGNHSLSARLSNFSNINEQFRVVFEHVSRNIQLKSEHKEDYLLNCIALEFLGIPQYYDTIQEHFSEEFTLLVDKAVNSKEISECRHLMNCVLLGNVVRNRNDLQGYALKYFSANPSPFETREGEATKRRKMQQKIEIGDLDIVESCLFLLRSNPDFYRTKWNWSQFIKKYINHKETKIKWIVCHNLAVLFGMNEYQLNKVILSKISEKDHRKYSYLFYTNQTLKEGDATAPSIDQLPVLPKEQIQPKVVNVSGIYIPSFNTSVDCEQKLVIVSSTYNNLRKIALGLASGKAICLQGSVGSGKTCLVEYLAAKTGRKLGENFLKIQLGDETDSKMLLGTYRCTDVPGEFVWQPGVLTQAVVEGCWLLLEDIDSASVDIASVITSLLENRSLTVPGYKDCVPITPGFQLFLTQRLTPTISGYHKKHSNTMILLGKSVFHITIDPLSSNELKQILDSKFPQFKTIADRMISVFLLFAPKSLDSDDGQISVPKSGRLISTRDFFKWCSRAVVDFDVKSQASALKVLQDAIDVFCCSFSNTDESLELAKQISTHLGIINQKAEYFFKTYKPTMQLTSDSLVAGRVTLEKENNQYTRQTKYSFTRPSAVLLERIMCCISLREPVLLVGETGTGKTSCVQFLAHTLGKKLIVINMNQQSDSADLLGGFKPVDMTYVIAPVRREFEAVFSEFFKIEPNRKYLANVALCFNSQRWGDLLKLINKSYEAALSRLAKSVKEFEASSSQDQDKYKQYEKNKMFLGKWQRVGEKLHKLGLQLKQKSALAFAFIEGSLVKAVENGHWVLLDEINLANAETLECLSGLLEGSEGSLCLLERGDKKPVQRHPDFTLFACMNPSTDVGKKDLPAGLRNRFTEFFVDELNEKSDLTLLVNNYLEAMSLKQKELKSIVDFYVQIKKEMVTSLSDGLGHKPHFSLRSLCRALMIASKNPCGMFKRSLYEAFCLSFLTQLDNASYQVVEKLISRYLIGDEKLVKAVLKQPIPEPKTKDENYLQFEGYWVKKGPLDGTPPDNYILTDSVRKNLKDLVRVVSIGKLPVLLQGDTSVGKTSLITYLAKSSGNKCVRINNHEHTDLQEYIGSYVVDVDGKLVFREGVLVEAMRKGHWIILDELNLAPTDVLEALNRVLDDNRELFIPETQETVRADPNFMLFATQNPPGAYGGRKMLSRAFRNRFVELHFNEIPPKELEVILHQRCQMAPSYARKMIAVMTDLQTRRRGSAAFAGKQGFITLRDLFRWGERYRLAQNVDKLYDWDQHLADEGYLVLAGRVRKLEEKSEIIAVLKRHLKREVVPEYLFTLSDKSSTVTKKILEKIHVNQHVHPNIVWTYNMRQLAVLVSKALQFKEPVLLVGETGGGKTTVCQLIADHNGQQLVTVNCHMHTESGDFIGGLRPVRDHSDEDTIKLFEWSDGPLIKAMAQGSMFLADEISLADDSVLERLNSLLEPERTLLVAEKSVDLHNTESSETVVAHENFHFIGTMNPGGDFGKKELSPALRNRFTEIWCEPCNRTEDLIAVAEKNVKQGLDLGNQEDGSTGIGKRIVEFVEWFRKSEVGKRFTVSIRDILTWVNFINKCASTIDIAEAYVHGACLTFLDSLGSGVTSTESPKDLEVFRSSCTTFLLDQVRHVSPSLTHQLDKLTVEKTKDSFGIKPFFIESLSSEDDGFDFVFNASTTVYNTMRLLRGMQLNKAILLEGSPGVGKTSLVTALAECTGHELFRVNLSDQTDISDLFGADLPVEGGTGGQFSWRDGPLLQALKNGSWILLDELNLASQSVLEGLNACLDHRGEIYIPELDKTFHVKPGTKFFGCQNPLKQGGSRRGLPRSFLNRFIQVYVTPLTKEDLDCILEDKFTSTPSEIRSKMIEFNTKLASALDSHEFGHQGAPWECNLRDIYRWCEVTAYHHQITKTLSPESTMTLIYSDRMRCQTDKDRVADIFERCFGRRPRGFAIVPYVTNDRVYLGDVSVERGRVGVNEHVLRQERSCLVLRSQLSVLRSLAYCVNMGWMAILTGSSGSGKSLAVKTLANLSGKSLRTLPVSSAMDTSDLLGGFEQTDYSRHLDEISKELERFSFETIHTLLENNQQDSVIELLTRWEVYRRTNVSAKHTMDEEVRQFLKSASKLRDILETLKHIHGNSHIVEGLDKKLFKVTESVEREKSLNAGGKFEWVDSVLIKCLRNGDWLLIDNVNLCSAAVLDRLNALLEPRGVLTVSERGVAPDGKVVEIKPHKDFRLFLTMDPKNGEISRAMRNRGVEIHLMSFNDISEPKWDTLSLMDLEGLKDTKDMMALCRVETFLNDLILGEKPQLNELLKTASLIAQQLQQGTELKEAFCSAVIEVYYKSRPSVEFNCNNPFNMIHQEVTRIVDEAAKGREVECYKSCVTLKTRNFECSSVYEKICHQGFILETAEENLSYILASFFSVSSENDLEARYYFLQNKVAQSWLPLVLQLCEVTSSFNGSQNPDLPLDHQWLPDTTYTVKHSKINLLTFALLMACEYYVEKDVFNAPKLTKRQITLMDYMHQKQKKIVEDRFNEIIINEYLVLIRLYDDYVSNIIKELHNLSIDDLVDMLYLIHWRFVLQKCTLKPISKISTKEQYHMIVNLKVHYKWFYKLAVRKVELLTNIELPDSLKEVLFRINRELDTLSVLQKVSKSYRRQNKVPPPLVSKHQLDVITKYNRISRRFDVCDTNNNVVEVLNHFETNKELRKFLVDFKSKLGFDFDEMSEDLQKLVSLDEMYRNERPSTKIDERELQLLPLVDHFNHLEIIRSFSSSDLDPLVDNVLVPINLSGTWLLYTKTKDDTLLHELSTSYYLYLINSASVRPFKFFHKTEGGDGSQQALSDIAPKISYYVNSLLSNNDNGGIVKLGNFRQLRKQHDQLTAILWRNFYQLCGGSYDFLECQKKYVTELMSKFISELALGLSVDEPTIANVISKLEVIREHDELSDPKEELLMLTDRLKKCATDIERLSDINLPESIYLVADVYMEIGYIKARLNSKLPLIDPLAKKTLKKEHCADLINRFTKMLQYYEKQNMIYSGSEETLHAICEPIKEMIKNLKYKYEVTYKYVAVRSEEVLYEAMLKEINFAFSTFLNPKHVSSSVNKILHNRISELLDPNASELIVDENEAIRELSQVESSIANYEMLVRGWSNFKDSYPDIIHPLLASLTEFLYGLKLKLALFRKLLSEHKYKKCLNVNIDEDLTNFCKFPVLDEKQNSYGDYVKMLTSSRIKDLVDHVLKSGDDIGVGKRENLRLLKCAIQEAFNHCVIECKGTDYMNRSTFAEFIEFVDVFIYAWNKQQEEKEIQEKEAESLYKTRTKCDDQSEEEQISAELKELFPDYHTTDYSDFQKSLEFAETTAAVEETIKDTVTYEDLKFVMSLHTSLVKNFTKSEWLNPDKNNNINHDFLLPVLEKQKVFAKILEKTHHALIYKVDAELLGSMNVVLAVTQRYGDITQITDIVSPTRMLNKKSSDFYKDSNVEEVKSCYHILEELKRKILELLQEWPDQPTLRDIITLIERIYSFDINSPISRYLTGFEILLSKCHEWEEVAHSGVSLSDFSKNLTEQIICWRKLELNMWKDLLNKTYDRMNEPISKWWLYIYNICDQFITKSISETDLIQTLQTFITKSNLAEFQSRLDLLYVFHCHATQLPKSEEIGSLISIFWNLYCYFEQYSQIIANKIKDVRSPIEKKLKDYVKIVRWKDINYWAIKETVDKSHRTLHKYMREFRDVLQQPVMPHLHNLEIGTRETEGIWDRPQRQNPSIHHYTLDADIYVAKQSLTKKIQAGEEGILSKAESYFLKSRKLCKETILATEYPNLVQSLDGFVTEIIETNKHLQSLEVDKSLPKEKQISQAKSILQQKHRALADLFKNLNKIGLSYKTGILESKLKKPSDDFVHRPIDLIKNFSHINHGRQEEKMLTIWNCCEMYYMRSQIRIDVLETALQNPSKDLGPQNIERCKGFSAHLLALAQHQKQQLTQSSRLYYYLRYYLLQMNEFCEGNDFLHTDVTNRITTFLKNTTVVMNQYKIILNTCPSEDDFGSTELIEVPVLKFGAREGVCYKYSNCWSETVALINGILNVCKKMSVLLQKCKKLAPAVEYDLVVPEFVPVPDLTELLRNLTSIKDSVGHLKEIFDNNSTTCSLIWLQKEVIKIIEQCQENKSIEINFEKCKKQSAKLTEEILVVIQNLYKRYSAVEKVEKMKEDEDESVELRDENLKKLLIENLVSDVSNLEMKKILTRTHKLAKIVLSTPPQDIERVRKIAYQSMPLLEQLVQFYQYFITQQVAAYRVTCKMMSILLNIFIELASKGFCIPPDLSDEMDKEGVSKPSDGLGLGEGQGERDVSDKIESEDQLEDAQPAGQEKKQEEDQECKEEEKGIEMSEDFEGKMQDVDKKDDEDDSEKSSDDDEDADEQMGETEKGADQLDQEIWGSDKEEEEGDEQESEKEEKGDKGEKEGESQLGAKEQNPTKDEQDKDGDDNSEEKEKSKKEINEMEEPEFDDDQVDPHHGDQKELPEPEPMDLPDDLQLDEGEQDDKQDGQEENPFDVDTMKEQNIPEEKTENEADNPDVESEDKGDEAEDFSSDDEDINKGDQNPENVEVEESEEKDKEDIQKGDQEADNAEQEDDEAQNTDDTALDQTQSNQDNVEAMETDKANAADKTQATDSDAKQPNTATEDIQQEDQPDKDGAGQTQMEESTTGHSAATSAPQETKSSKREAEEEVKQKPGDSDSQRSLGDVDRPVRKKLKTVDSKISKEQEPKDVEDETEQTAEMYEHIKEGQESNIQILDIATKEQAESQKKEAQHKDDEGMDEEEAVESSEQIPEEQIEEMDISDIPKEKSEKVEETKEKQGKKGQHPEGDVLEEVKEVQIEGDVVQTSSVPRPTETTHHTSFTDLSATTASRLTMAEMTAIRGEVEQQLAAWSDPPGCAEAERAWQKISSVTGGLAQELSEQLRLVLEPTLASRLKGDFRTGRRINMRKVIPYIASQFRKDKIWLRRTKPSKRDYQIVIAIDDSSSMADNHSKELAFESVALISKALTLLESGQLSVVSFGERVEVIHKLTEQFTDRSGTKLLQRFRFDQTRTNVGKLVDFATEMLNQSQKQATAVNAKLLVIVSDGRGVFSEGETYVRQAVRRAKLADIFVVFVIVDNPESKSSVLDIRMPVFRDNKLLGIESYMDFFPFSFYIILRDINSLPNVLSDALRQWFEIVSNLDK